MARARASKLRPPEGASVHVPAPWQEMDPEAEAAARRSYLHAYSFAGGTPCARVGETWQAAFDRCGGHPRLVWHAIRFDPDDEVRRSALRSVLEQAAHGAWYAIERAAIEDWPEARFERRFNSTLFRRQKADELEVGGALTSPRIDSRLLVVCPIEIDPNGEGEDSQALRERLAASGRDHVVMLDELAQRITDPALAGLRVTEQDVVDTPSERPTKR